MIITVEDKIIIPLDNCRAIGFKAACFSQFLCNNLIDRTNPLGCPHLQIFMQQIEKEKKKSRGFPSFLFFFFFFFFPFPVLLSPLSHFPFLIKKTMNQNPPPIILSSPWNSWDFSWSIPRLSSQEHLFFPHSLLHLLLLLPHQLIYTASIHL